ncbi:MAG: transglycosylase domain-containing protein, partial [Chthoniobacteraceae bacterium]
MLGITACCLGWFIWFVPLPESLTDLKPLTGNYLDCKGRLIAELAGPEARSHRPIALSQMGPWVPQIAIAMEDRRFRSHPGVDWEATARAILTRHGGGSTITQQLVKVAMHRTGRSLFAKAHEALVALQLERRWTKERILEAYLNRIPYGNRLIGVEAASQTYFNKPAAALTKAEAIYLSGLPRQPSLLNPWSHPEAAGRQFERSCRILAARGWIDAHENEELHAPEIGRHLPVNAAPHFIQLAVRPGQRGVVRCTLDLDLQRRAEQLVRENLAMLHRPDITEAAMVIMENDSGAIRALVGSRDFQKNQINGARSFRNCGSTLKPFLYVTGIDQRIFTAATLLPDTADAARDAYMDYDPHNFVLSHLGPVRVREALGNSLNVPAVVTVSRIGARKAFNAIGDWGIRFDQPLEKTGAGFILGNVGVRLIDLTAAFSGLARGGLAGPPKFLETDAMPLRRVVSADAAAIVTDILCDNSARLQSFGPHSSLAFPIRVAAKTGTSAGFRDAWAEGFTREHTVGVWMGNFDGKPMDHAASIASSAPLWRRMMDDLLLADHPVPEAKLRRVQVCSVTGLRPCAASPATVGELFLPGTEPREKADAW